MRYGDQEQSSPGETASPLGTPKPPVARAEARLAEQDDTRQVPHQRQAPLWRRSVLRRSQALRAVPSLSRFLRPAEPGDTRIGQDPARRASAHSPDAAARPDARDSLDVGENEDVGESLDAEVVQGIEASRDAAVRAEFP